MESHDCGEWQKVQGKMQLVLYYNLYFYVNLPLGVGLIYKKYTIKFPVFIKSKKMVVPLFLKLPMQDQRMNFNTHNVVESERLNEALNSPNQSDWSISDAVNRQNVQRNRYSNVFPWNKTRVRLPVEQGHSDYINASYISMDNRVEYIATQGPLEETIHHFWSMCYNESERQKNDTVIIAMVTPLVEGGMKKCSQYWPTKSNPLMNISSLLQDDGIEIPGLALQYVSESYNEKGDFLRTELELKSKTQLKKVYHLYYYKWADAKVPPSIGPLLSLSEEIRLLKKSCANEPVPIIHCSAGVGRTGTFIALDQLVREYSNEVLDPGNSQSNPIEGIVTQLRKERMMMVQTVYQYCFLYDVMKEMYKKKLQN